MTICTIWDTKKAGSLDDTTRTESSTGPSWITVTYGHLVAEQVRHGPIFYAQVLEEDESTATDTTMVSWGL